MARIEVYAASVLQRHLVMVVERERLMPAGINLFYQPPVLVGCGTRLAYVYTPIAFLEKAVNQFALVRNERGQSDGYCLHFSQSFSE